MSNYRRLKVSGATYFFTVKLADRGSALLVEQIGTLRKAFFATMAEQPFWADAMVILPDHIHAIWTLPEGDSDFSNRWRKIKSRFTQSVEYRPSLNRSLEAKGEKGIWQRRFWEHCIRDDEDYSVHLEYCWSNPIKHGLVEYAKDWPYSSFHRDVIRKIVPEDWV
ncbi:MAG: transposase [Rhodobacteraceae bacterium]|nr:transposase [Paracoccaceae bacterium]